MSHQSETFVFFSDLSTKKNDGMSTHDLDVNKIEKEARIADALGKAISTPITCVRFTI
jgi:hypothetical protein